MTETDLSVRYVDGEVYEKFMGQWSRACGRKLVEWLGIPAGLKWLDVGCGTGAFTSVILEACAPKSIVGIDAMETQLVGAKSRVTDERVDFRVGDAQALPFDDDAFDAAASALVLNFVPDHKKMVTEMKRVVRPSGTVAVYVWDFAGGGEIAQHIGAAIAARDPKAADHCANVRHDERTRLEALSQLFKEAGLDNAGTLPIEIGVEFGDFDFYWSSNIGFASPVAIYANGLSSDDREQFMGEVKERLPIAADGSIRYTARASAVRGYVPQG